MFLDSSDLMTFHLRVSDEWWGVKNKAQKGPIHILVNISMVCSD